MSKAVSESVADDVLVRRAHAGDSAAFVEFATRWWPVAGRVTWSMLGNATQAAAATEDVLGTALLLETPPELPIPLAMYRLAIWIAIVRRRSNGQPAGPRRAVLEALDRVDPIDRAALVLRDVEQLSVAEIAIVLEMPAEEIRRRAHRARLALMRVLGNA